MRQTEPAANQPRITEELPDLPRMGIRGRVKILGGLPQEEIPDAPSHQVAQKPMVVKPVQDLKGVRVDVFSGNRVLGPGKNSGGNCLIHGIAWQFGKAYYILAIFPTIILLTNRGSFVKETFECGGQNAGKKTIQKGGLNLLYC